MVSGVRKGRVEEFIDKENKVDVLIHFWESKLEVRGLFSPAVLFFLEATVVVLRSRREEIRLEKVKVLSGK